MAFAYVLKIRNCAIVDSNKKREVSISKATLVFQRGQKVAAQFKSLCLFMLQGSMGSGKSWLTFRIMWHTSVLYDHEIAKILYCYQVNQPHFTQMERDVVNVTFYKGLPSEAYLREFAEMYGLTNIFCLN